MNFDRASGVLLHPTSLPGAYGIGEIGPEAYAFVEKLKEMGQGLWQILPLGPTSYGDSPYQSLSTFAGNPLWISFDLLLKEKLLTKSQLKSYPVFPSDGVDFGPVIQARFAVLQAVCRSFSRNASAAKKKTFAAYCDKNAYWLDDFALFVALKDAHGGIPWTQWEPELGGRQADALKKAAQQYRAEIRNAKILQFLFDDQWSQLRQFCHEKGIKMVGDIPIFVAHDSADVWAHPELYYLDDKGFPTVVAGVPPDYFSSTGQLWGNPLYRWDVHRNTGYAWWVARMRKIFEVVDIVRIDHFRGFEQYWEVPAHEKTAIHGHWVDGPKASLFEELNRQLGALPIIAEDLGIITHQVEALRDQFKFPGMRILQFAFGNDDKASTFRPENYPPNCVVYSGTHDNDTTVGWFNSQAGQGSTRSQQEIDRERRTILEYLRTDGHEIHWDLIELGMRSHANTAVFPMQDIMGLGSNARMNTPGVAGGNWRWRFTWGMLTPAMIERLRYLTRATGRLR
ncbi:MAG: 4-alpha-glucanotransferase [Lentisphaerae bacterium GWF2_57_35]|nr:MAG: 4-alpha-glucanotransferase [Lentisphaerae bacterium GWF2_57_35]